MAFENTPQITTIGTSDARAYLNNHANAVIRVRGLPGISGFLFDVPDGESITVDWDVTDHYTENNSFLNDHKTRRPVIITLSGFVGELVYRAPTGLAAGIQALTNRLETVEAYLGNNTPGGVQLVQSNLQQAQRTISAINQTIEKGQSLVNFFSGEGQQETEQQRAYRTLSALGDTVLLTVQTPWEFFQNMTIISLAVSQDGETNDITDISVTLKQIRISEIQTTDFSQDQLPIREQSQAAPTSEQGVIRGENTRSSVLFETGVFRN